MPHKKQRIYRKKPGAVPALSELLPVASRVKRACKAAAAVVEGPRAMVGEANRIVLDRYAPPSVLVDENLQVVQFNGQTGLFLEPSPGEPSFHVLKLAREGLLHGLRSALQSAKKTRRTARDLEVIPMTRHDQTFYLALFEPRQDRDAGERKETRRKRTAADRAGTQGHRLARLVIALFDVDAAKR